MHLVSDPEKYLNARRNQNVPFFHTACGSAEPIARLTTEPKLVSCLACEDVISRAFAEASPSAPALAAKPFDESIDADLDDMDDIDAAFDEGLEITNLPSPDQEPTKTKQVDEEASPFAAFQPMLETVFAGFDADEVWKRWTMTPDVDPQGSDGMLIDQWDPRSILNPEQAAFIQSLAEISSLVGLEGLSSRVLTLIHQIAVSSYDPDANPRRFPAANTPRSKSDISIALAKDVGIDVQVLPLVETMDQGDLMGLPYRQEGIDVQVASPDAEEE